MGTTVGVVLILNFACICVGIAGIVAGAIGHSWWKTENLLQKTEVGLWRSCTLNGDSTVCGTSRSRVLEFHETEKHLDIILILLIGGGFFGIWALTTAAAMFCCQRKRSGWLCGSILVTFTTLLAAGVTLAALVYAELETKWENDKKRGWSVIATWIGLGMFILSFMLSTILACLVPRRDFL